MNYNIKELRSWKYTYSLSVGIVHLVYIWSTCTLLTFIKGKYLVYYNTVKCILCSNCTYINIPVVYLQVCNFNTCSLRLSSNFVLQLYCELYKKWTHWLYTSSPLLMHLCQWQQEALCFQVVCLSVYISYSCESNLPRMPWGHFFKLNTNVHWDSNYQLLVARGQRSTSRCPKHIFGHNSIIHTYQLHFPQKSNRLKENFGRFQHALLSLKLPLTSQYWKREHFWSTPNRAPWTES